MQPIKRETEAKLKAYDNGSRVKQSPMIGAATTVPTAPAATVMPMTVPE